ncbi:MAG: AsmA-like C-terminal region-containing protein [Bacteroidales bacterium]|nr:AsmA-like C-terminal region-containing protein [Bacteroidales bacterium]
MKKLLKVLLAIVLAIIVLLVTLPWIFKSKIVSVAKSEMNKQVNAIIDFDKVSLSLIRNFPDFSLGFDGLSVINQTPFEGDTLIYIGSLRLTIDLWSVMKGETYEVKRISLHESEISLMTNENGAVNWDIVKPGSDTLSIGDQDKSEESAISVRLNDIRLSKVNLRYLDKSLSLDLIIKGLNGGIKGDFASNTATLQTSLLADELNLEFEKVNYLKKIKTKLDMELITDLDNSIYAFKNAKIVMNDLALGIEGSIEMPSDDILIQLELNALNNSFGSLLSLVPSVYAKGMDKVVVNGNFSINGFAKGIYNEKSMPGFGFELLVEGASFHYPDLPQKVENIAIHTTVVNDSGDPDATILWVKKFDFTLGGNPFSSGVKLKSPVSDPDIDAFAKGVLNLADLSKVMHFEEGEDLVGMLNFDFSVIARLSDVEKQNYERVNASGNIGIQDVKYKSSLFTLPVQIAEADLQLTPSHLKLTKFRSIIGKSDMTLQGILENYLPYYLGKGALVGNVDLTSDLLDVNELIASLPSSDEPQEEIANSAAAPVNLPENIEFVFNGKMKKVLYEKMELTDATARIMYKDKKITFDPMQARMIDGTVEMKGSLDFSNNIQPLIGLDFAFNSFDIPMAYRTLDLFQKAAPIAERSTGKFSGSFNLEGKLNAGLDPVYESLIGKGALKTTQLIVENSKTMSGIASALGNSSFNQLKTDGLNFSFEFLDGKVYQKPFTLKYGDSDVTIGGNIDFDQNLDYDMVFKIPFEKLGPTVASGIEKLVGEASKLTGMSINPGTAVQVLAKVSGKATDPKISLDYSKYSSSLKTGLEDLAKKEFDKQKEVVRENVKAEAEKILNEARKQADEIVKQAEIAAANIRSEALKAANRMKSEADKQADNLVSEGKKKGMVAEFAAKEAAKKLKKETDDSAAKVIEEGNKKAEDVIRQANRQADDILIKAKERADKI